MAGSTGSSQDTRRRFEQWARNPRCAANAVSAILNIPMADVAKREGARSPTGQSPFALARGQGFERAIFRDDAKMLRDELESNANPPFEWHADREAPATSRERRNGLGVRSAA